MAIVLPNGLHFQPCPPASTQHLAVPSRSLAREQRGLDPLPLEGKIRVKEELTSHQCYVITCIQSRRCRREWVQEPLRASHWQNFDDWLDVRIKASRHLWHFWCGRMVEWGCHSPVRGNAARGVQLGMIMCSRFVEFGGDCGMPKWGCPVDIRVWSSRRNLGQRDLGAPSRSWNH